MVRMRWKPVLIRAAAAVLILGLLFMSVPAGSTDAESIPGLVVDIYTNKGGFNINVPGGEYRLGEKPFLYYAVSIGCRVEVVLSGPYGTKTYPPHTAIYNVIYPIQLGVAEEADIGQWRATIYAETMDGTQSATDTVAFTVYDPSSLPVIIPPTPPADEPDPSPPPPPAQEEPVDRIDAAGATLLDALRALKMANGDLAEDLRMDADGDGSVSREDARLILKWAVEGRTRTVS